MELEQVFAAVGGVVVTVLLIKDILKDFYIQKSIPVEQLPELFARLKEHADKTETPVDNILINAGEELATHIGYVKPEEQS